VTAVAARRAPVLARGLHDLCVLNTPNTAAAQAPGPGSDREHRAVPSTSSAGQRALSSRATSSHGIGLGPSSRSSRRISPQSTKAET
jgi:hypothetical protein